MVHLAVFRHLVSATVSVHLFDGRFGLAWWDRNVFGNVWCVPCVYPLVGNVILTCVALPCCSCGYLVTSGIVV